MAYEIPQFGDSADGDEFLAPVGNESPNIDLTIGEITYNLTWENTIVRLFKIGNGKFDHFLHSIGEDNCIYIFFTQAPESEELRTMFTENDYPTYSSPILDDDTIAWYDKVQSLEMGVSFPDDIVW